jgi:hypothetical protein
VEINHKLFERQHPQAFYFNKKYTHSQYEYSAPAKLFFANIACGGYSAP